MSRTVLKILPTAVPSLVPVRQRSPLVPSTILPSPPIIDTGTDPSGQSAKTGAAKTVALSKMMSKPPIILFISFLALCLLNNFSIISKKSLNHAIMIAIVNIREAGKWIITITMEVM